MRPTGLIFAGLDCDADAIEAWNRWYDLEHVPPNVSMPGVMLGRRYVAPPALHALRKAAPGSGFADGRGTFLTLYTLCQPPESVFASMTTLRDKLYAEDRMNFPAEKGGPRGRCLHHAVDRIGTVDSPARRRRAVPRTPRHPLYSAAGTPASAGVVPRQLGAPSSTCMASTV